jgi:hypothetical protein
MLMERGDRDDRAEHYEDHSGASCSAEGGDRGSDDHVGGDDPHEHVVQTRAVWRESTRRRGCCRLCGTRPLETQRAEVHDPSEA